MNLKIWQKILLIVTLPILFEIVFVVTLAALLLKTEQLSDQFDSSKSALLRYHGAEEALVQGLLTLSAIDLKSDKDFSREFDFVLEKLRVYQKSVSSSFAIRQEIREAFAELPEMFDHSAKMLERIKLIFRHPPSERTELGKELQPDAVAMMVEAKPISDRIAAGEAQMHLKAPSELNMWRWYVSITTVAGLVLNLIISICIAILFFRNIAKRLEIIEENAHRVASGKPLQAPLNDKDEIGQLDAALHKASDLVQDARKKEFAILEQSVDVLCSLDRRLRIVDIGESVLKAWQHRADELLGRSMLTLVPPLERERLTTLLLEVSATGKETEFECQLVCGDTTVKDILWKVTWTQPDKMFYCVAHDVTERRVLARQKQQLISVAGHDLRTPLTSVSSTFALITEGARGELSETALKELSKASQSLERLMELVRDLLDLEKLDAGKMVLEFSSVSALDVCNVAIDSVSSLAQKFGVKIQAPWQDALLLGDERRLVQILINFLSNAIKFSPREGVVTVAIKAGDDFVELSVADQGAGIPAHDRDLIFEKFHQSKLVEANVPIKSTGLGLAIAKVLTEGHNGTIGVESELGLGSRFFVRIPAFKDTPEFPELET